jgi:opacity protein-like surface antigen
MKKIAIIAFLLAVSVAVGSAQESRQDFSLSGTALVEPFVASPTNVYVSANRAFGALGSYRFMLTPSSAFEANYGMTYQNSIHYVIRNGSGSYNYLVSNRVQEISGAFVHTFHYRKYNPFIEGGPGVFLFRPVRNSGTTDDFVKPQKEIGALYGAGIAYEISPSFDIRVEMRGVVTKVPTFGQTGPPNSDFATNKWYNIYNPVIGVAYHF